MNPTEKENLANKTREDFETASSFFDSLNLRRDIKRCVNFESGNQWNMDEDVKDFPKITLNIVKQVGKVRKSGVLQNEYAYLVDSDNFGSVRKIQDFIKYQNAKMKMKKKDLKVLSDTFTKGTGIIYFYWDAQARDLLSKSGGRLKAEVIDVRHFRVADPYIQDIQEQEYVMYVTRERLDSIKAQYGVEAEGDTELYTIDTEKQPMTGSDQTKQFATVYTKFYRNEDGQVFFVISTATKLLKEPTPLNPFYKGDKEEQPNTTSLPDAEKAIIEAKQEKFGKEVFNLYPFASLVVDERDNCFYGIPGALELIEAQKSINNHFSVYDKGVQDNVLGGFVRKRGVMGEQEITTENGQIIDLDLLPNEDYRNVFGRIPVNNVPADALNYSNSLLGVVRNVSGATNVQIGTSDYSGQSGKQTQLLLDRAKENSSDVAMLFNEFKKEQAEIIFLFSKFFYDNEDFTVIEHGVKQDSVRQYKDENKFDGNKYMGDNVMIDIKVGPGQQFSEYSSVELLGLALQSGQVPLEVYIASLPDGYVNNRDELVALAKDNSLKTIEALQGQLKQATQVMEQMSKAFQKTQKDMQNIDTVVQENFRLKSMMAEVASKSIKVQQEASAKNMELTKDMQDLLNTTKRIAVNSGSKKKSSKTRQ